MRPKLGIIAGRGELPREIIDECRRIGRSCFVVALKGQADPEITTDCPHLWVRLGAAGKTIAAFRRENVSELVMAGSVNRPSLLQLCPDLWALRFFLRTGVANKGDNSLLQALVNALETREGFQVVGAHTLLPDLLASEGCLGEVTPSGDAQRDIKVAWKAARDLGRRDVGQAVVARDGALVAEESASGTAAMLAAVRPDGKNACNGVLVKVAKPGQELRADMPTIGPDTLTQVSKAGLAGIAIEAGKTIILNKKETLETANRLKIFIVGLSGKNG